MFLILSAKKIYNSLKIESKIAKADALVNLDFKNIRNLTKNIIDNKNREKISKI